MTVCVDMHRQTLVYIHICIFIHMDASIYGRTPMYRALIYRVPIYIYRLPLYRAPVHRGPIYTRVCLCIYMHRGQADLDPEVDLIVSWI